MENNKLIKVAESQDNKVGQNEDSDKIKVIENQEQCVKINKKPLTPYQKYKNSRNQNGKKYFDFYDDIKVYTHNIWDW